MERVSIYFQLKPGAEEAYVKLHRNIWPRMCEVLDRSGMRNYSIWKEGARLFAYYEVEDKERMEKVLDNSTVYQQWRDLMEDYVYKDPETGQKEWFMEMVFLHEGCNESCNE